MPKTSKHDTKLKHKLIVVTISFIRSKRCQRLQSMTQS